MKKNTGTIIIDLLAILLSITLLCGASLAYFTDRVAAQFTGRAGSIRIGLASPERGKKVFAYDTMNDFSLSIGNDGNKSMDIQVSLTITSNMPISEGFSFSGETLPCYRLFRDSNAGYTYRFAGEPAVFTEQYSSEPLSGEDIPTEDGSHVLEYTFTGLLNGSPSIQDRETETGGTDSFQVPLYLYFPGYDGLPGWDLLARNAYYRLTVKVYGKQHRNTASQDWTLLDSFEA